MTLSSKQEKVLNNINEHNLIKMLRDLIKIPSQNPPGEEQRIAEYCADKCRRLGLDTDIVAHEEGRSTVIATLPGTQSKPVLLYHAHLDTVPVGDKKRWQFDPFGGCIQDKKIYGRGACDTKNDIAAMIQVAEALVKSGVSIEGNLILCFAADEEAGGRLGTAYALNQGYFNDVDMVVAGEQTGLRVGIAEKGAATLSIRTNGVSAHASQVTEKRTNAINKMGKILCTLDEKYLPTLKQRTHRLLGTPTYNAGVIKGGTRSNTVAEQCELQLDCRFLPGEKAEDIRQQIKKLIERLCQDDPDIEATIEIIREAKPFEIQENNPLVKQLRTAIEKIKGVDLGVTGYYPASDGRFFAHKNIPTVVFGSGNSLQAHTTDEYVEIDQVIDSTKILALLAISVLH